METTSPPNVKYQPCRCLILEREVWAILTKSPDGAWQIVNCLDKDVDCFGKECAFTMDGGHWPFE